MEAVFTLPYPEYVVATTLQNKFKKKDWYSVSIPLSRQQKGVDLFLYNQRNKQTKSIQIKSSRAYHWKEGWNYQYYAWFRRFDYGVGTADYYFFFILYPTSSLESKTLNKSKTIKKRWRNKIVVLSDNEMNTLFRDIKTKKWKPESFFGFWFDEHSDDIFVTRWLDNISYKNNLFENKVKEIENMFL